VERKTIDGLLAEARSRLQRLMPTEAHAAAQRGAVVIDVRLEGDRERFGVPPRSIWIPLNVFEWRADPGSIYRDPRMGGTDTHLIVMCAEGYSSSLAAARLLDFGWNKATDVIGGFEAWIEAGLPLESCVVREDWRVGDRPYDHPAGANGTGCRTPVLDEGDSPG
jgi:rhodanese-related sulfurtransferase